ncbi:hypothetical protein BR93DRAFT_976753 [Coniochaeta sp. PMI_546]|nr:hypothetical protein BR93DRAFT_976753 [Coniochaeta sp. PMI_546]
MPHHHKKPVSSLGQSYFTSSGNPKYNLSDPVLKSAIASLPDKHRALAIENFKKKKITAGSDKILEELEHYKSPFSEEQRIKLLKHRLRDPHGAEIKLATTLPNVAVLAPRVAKSSDLGDDNDPTRLAASVKTPTGTFDDVLALSQAFLNASFGYLWQLTPELQKINISNQFGSLVANLKAPKVSLTVVQPGPPLWYMNFDSVGELTLIQDNVPTKISTAGWVFVFAVNISMSGVDPNSPAGKAIANQLDNPGDYSISQLYADFTTADITNPRFDLCNFNGYQWPKGMFLYFQMFILSWLTNASEAGAGTMAYSVTTNNPGAAYPNAPSFPPTDLIFQCMPYYAPGQTAPTEGLGPAGDNNMLLYLEMSNNTAPPKERSLAYSGNWVTPSIPATMCISSDIFWNDYLLSSTNHLGPLLTMINQVTWVEAVDCTADYWSDSFSWTIGVNYPHPDSFWDWSPKSDGTGWTWSQTQGKNARDHSSPGCEALSSVTTSSTNNITLVPGSNIITVSGETTAYLTCDDTVLGINSHGWGQVKNDWSFTIQAVSILNGGLQLQVTLPPQDKDLWNISTDGGENWIATGMNLSGNADHFASWLAGWNIRGPANELQNQLNGTAKFVFPGAGTMLYKNPVFNNEHDIMVEAHYNGVTDWQGRKPVNARLGSFT